MNQLRNLKGSLILCLAALAYYLITSGISGFFERQGRLAQLENRPAAALPGSTCCPAPWYQLPPSSRRHRAAKIIFSPPASPPKQLFSPKYSP